MTRLGTVLLVLCSGLLLACQLQYVVPASAPSATPRPTRTQTPDLPKATAAPTLSPTSSAPVIATAKENLRVRAGPSASAQQIGSLSQGDTARIVGRTAASDWWQIQLPSNTSTLGWISASFTDVSGSVGSIPVVPSGSAP